MSFSSSVHSRHPTSASHQHSAPLSSCLSNALRAVSAELALPTIYHSPLDTKLLIVSRFVRFFAYGGTVLVLALFLLSLGINNARIGAFMTFTLLGDVGLSLLLTLFADRLGRRRILMLGAVMMVGSGVAFGLSERYWVLVVASIVGVISPR